LLENKMSKGHMRRIPGSGSSEESLEGVPAVEEPNMATLRPAVDRWDHFMQVLEDCEEEMSIKEAERLPCEWQQKCSAD